MRGNPSPFFEKWVVLELWRRLQYLRSGELCYLRTRDGAEIDFIIARPDALIPVEVKWTENPTLADACHLLTFLAEHPKKAKQGVVVCRCPHPMQLHDRILALPWQHL